MNKKQIKALLSECKEQGVLWKGSGYEGIALNIIKMDFKATSKQIDTLKKGLKTAQTSDEDAMKTLELL